MQQQTYRRWQISAENATSYRAKFKLATEIVKSDMSSREIRRAARRVVRTLETVIDLPIASADILRKAHERFGVLTELLLSTTDPKASNEKNYPEILILCIDRDSEPVGLWP
ncbi:hypothetical protein PYR71_22335 [Rhizobium sp. MC63]|uniref:Uncharacterized protein n=1 Tax=Rhizobium mulingense TaxID=3031128 RepID=A0ACC6N220_9HYPH|nr:MULTISPECIES: hypothetical protein [unclassified Rhizobium]MDF0699196.1 hypothetical protein [Rhizobium sp. MC63]MEA3519515.1 hypothetical protein [Rhizobium sp. MJ31]MEB3046123.1 hypothetical protein [Rhizobium sp. MJ21]